MSENPQNMQVLQHAAGKAKVMKYVTHLIVLAIIYVLPELLLSWGHKVPRIVYLHTLVYVAIFYLNYLVLIDKFLFRNFKNKVWAFALCNLALLIVYFFFMAVFHDDLIPIPRGEEFHRGFELRLSESMRMRIGHFLIRDTLMLVLSICLSITLKFSEKWVSWNMLAKQMIAEKNESELKNLKNQLNPHFLFNTLNNIYALIDISQQKAQHAVHELSQLLRYMLYDTAANEVPLEHDLLFVKNYIELMRLRLNSGVTLRVSIDEKSGEGLMIAPLMFISLVENAFKHGVSASEHTEIDISIGVEEQKVHCHVENTCVEKTDGDRSGSGVGIANLSRQLSIIYAGRHTYTTEYKEGKYIADLVIELCGNYAR